MDAPAAPPSPLVQVRLGPPTVDVPGLIVAPTVPHAGARRVSNRVVASIPGAQASVLGVPPSRAIFEGRAFWQRWLASLGDQREDLRCVAGPGANHLLSLVPEPVSAIYAMTDPVHMAIHSFMAVARRLGGALDVSGGIAPTVIRVFTALAEGQDVPGVSRMDIHGMFNRQGRVLLAGLHDGDALPASAGPPPDADVWRQRLRDIVARYYTLGAREHLDVFGRLLQRKFAWWQPERRPPETRWGSLATALPSEVREVVAACNWLDVELHRELVARFRPARFVPPRTRGSGRAEIYLSDGPAGHPPLVFQHIPKTAGTTLRELLRRNHEHVTLHEVQPSVDEDGSPQQWFEVWIDSLSPSDRARIVCIAGHAAGYTLPFLPAADALCVLRDPVERVLSRWWFSGQRAITAPPDPERVISWPLEDIYEQLGGGGRPEPQQHEHTQQFFNGQARILMQPFCDEVDELGYTRGPGPDADVWRERAFAALERFRFAGVTERLDELVRHLAGIYGWKVVRVAPRKRKTRRPRDGVESPELRALIREHNWLDAELHEHVLARWPARVDAT